MAIHNLLKRPVAIVAALMLAAPFLQGGELKPASKLLKDGDIIAVCGDSITSNGYYPGFFELYRRVCAPVPEVKFVNFGRWGWTARQFGPIIEKEVLPSKPTVVTFCYGMNSGRGGGITSEDVATKWGKGVQGIIGQFRKGGVREFLLGSPGCVDSDHCTRGQGIPPSRELAIAANKSLALLRDAARKVAADEKVHFVDVHSAMIEVMAKAKKRHGKEFAFAGGPGDGLHPAQAGHLVMAWAFMKGLGYDGDLGSITVDLAAGNAVATNGHKVIGTSGGTVELESIRYPFCFFPNPYSGKIDGNSTLSVADLFPFNEDLNRLTLVVKGAGKGKYKVTWGEGVKTVDAARLEKGINLAAEFMEKNPFKKSFNKVWLAMVDRGKMLGILSRPEHKDNVGYKNRLKRAIENLKVKPVKHVLKIEKAE